jgi:hypothetical protein
MWNGTPWPELPRPPSTADLIPPSRRRKSAAQEDHRWAEYLHHGELPASLRTARLHHKPGAVEVVGGAMAGKAHDEVHAAQPTRPVLRLGGECCVSRYVAARSGNARVTAAVRLGTCSLA